MAERKFLYVNAEGDYQETLGAFESADFLDSRPGSNYDGKPLKTTTSGYLSLSFLNIGDIDHGSLNATSLTHDDHTQYSLASGGRAYTGIVSYNGSKSFTSPYEIVDKEYVDSVAQGLNPKQSVKVATTAYIDLTGTQTIDSIALSADQRVLVKNQGDGRAEVHSVDTVPVSSLTQGDYFAISTPTDTYWLWYDIDDAGTGSPTPGGSEILVEVNVLTGDNSAAVATKTKTALDAIVGTPFVTTRSTNELTITNTAFGAATDVTDGTATTGFTFATDIQGVDAGADTEKNGIYLVKAGAWVRASDANAWSELVSAFTFVEEGTTNKDTGWVCIVDTGGALETDDVVWTKFSSAGEYSASKGVKLVGLDFQASIAASSGIKLVNTNDLAIEPNDFAGDGLIDDGSDNLAIDWATTFTISGADNKAIKASALATTSSGYGAAIIGIQDAGGYYTGLSVEAALTELKNQISGDTSTTYDFTESNVLADNDKIYAALNKIDLKFGDLFSTTTGEGASLIGISDAGAYTTATNVESSLQEIYGLINSFGVKYTVDAGQTIDKGDLLFISSANKVSKLDIDAGSYAIGIAATAGNAGDVITVLGNDTVCTGILSTATAGTKYYWTWDGATGGWSTTRPTASGKYTWQGGIAKNASDLQIEIGFVTKNA